jgi:hypothetical protein
MALPSTLTDGCLSASTSVYAGTSRGVSSWTTSHDRHQTYFWTGQRCHQRPLLRRVRHCGPHHTTHWPHQKTATTSSEHSWDQPPLYGWINYQSPAPRSRIYCDTSAGRPRPYVSAPLRLQVFQSVHDLSHPGTKATAKLVARRLVWPGVQKDCRTWALACESCQRSKVSRHTVTPLGNFTPPAARFMHVHINLVGPLPTSAGYTYCLTAVDRFTRWPEVITADTMARALLTGWISRIGCPQTRDGSFNSSFSNPCQKCVTFSCPGRQPTTPRLTDSHKSVNYDRG